jgi:ABC-type transporter Mla MlaB component
VIVLVRDGRDVASWPVTRAGRVDVGVVDALARLQLAARRHGCSIRLEDASDELAGLVRLCGLSGVLGDPEPRPPGAQ